MFVKYSINAREDAWLNALRKKRKKTWLDRFTFQKRFSPSNQVTLFVYANGGHSLKEYGKLSSIRRYSFLLMYFASFALILGCGEGGGRARRASELVIHFANILPTTGSRGNVSRIKPRARC